VGQWWSDLPAELLNDAAQKQPQFRSASHLRLEFCLIRMFVARPFLFRQESSSNHSFPENGQTETPDASNNDRPTISCHTRVSPRKELIGDCILAAKESLEVCRSLRDSGPGLARASYIEYSSCRASLLVLIAHSIQVKSDEYSLLLRDGLDMIRDMSAAGDSARSEVSLIESLERALTRLHFFGLRSSVFNKPSSSSVLLPSEYDQFKNWESSWKSSGKTVAAAQTSSLISPTPVRQPSQSEAQLEIVDHNSHNFSTGMPKYSGADALFLERGEAMDNSRSYYSPTDFAFMNGANMPTTSTQTNIHETQVLEEFLAIPDFTLDSGQINWETRLYPRTI
jgi:hypothetical protein